MRPDSARRQPGVDWRRTLSAVCSGLLALCAFTAIIACTPAPTSLQNAQRLYVQGDLDAALAESGTAMEKDTLDGEVLLLRGRVLVALGDGRRAQHDLRAALALGIGHDRLDAVLARAMLLDGQAERLLKELLPAPMHQGEVLSGLHVARGLAQLSLGQAEPARASFAQALVADPDCAEALLAEARAHYASGQPAAAATRIDRVLQLKPRLAEAWLFKGELLQVAGQADAAMLAYAQAEQLQPQNVLPRLAAARILIDQGRLEPAQVHLDSVLRMAPNHAAATFAQALLYFQARDHEQAQTFIEATLRLVPDHAPALFLLAGTELAQGAVQKAQARYLKTVQATPGDLLARKLYVASVLQTNDPAGALQALQPVMAQTPADVELLGLAGQAYLQTRNHAQASLHLQRAAALQADPTAERVRLGLDRLSSGDAEQGLDDLTRAAPLDGGGTRADLALARSQLQRRDFDAALRAARRLQVKQPGQPLSYNLAGAAQAGLGDRAAARASFDKALALQAGYRPAAINLALLDQQAGRPDSARQRLLTLLRQEPGNIDAIGALARVDAAPGGLLRLLEQARTADPHAVPVRVMLARERLAAADPEGALRVAREAQALAPDSAPVLEVLGAVYAAAGNKSQAVASLEKLVRISAGTAGAAGTAGTVGARWRLAGAYAAIELWGRAEDEYRRVIGLQPDHADALTDLARLHAARGQFVAARALADELVARHPRSGRGQELRGDLLLRQQRPAEAAAAYDAALAIAPRGALAVKQHGAARLANPLANPVGNPASGAGLQRIEQWLDAHPDDHPTRQYLADQQLAAGATAAAIASYQQVLAAEPGNAFALNNLALALRAQGDPRALPSAEAAYRLRPDHPQIADTLGWMLVQGDQPARGLKLIQQAAADLGQAPEIGLHLAVALARTGDKLGARALIKRRLDLGQDIRLDAPTRALLQGT